MSNEITPTGVFPLAATDEIATCIHTTIEQIHYCYKSSLNKDDFGVYLNTFFDDLARDPAITPEAIIREFTEGSDCLHDPRGIEELRLITAVRVSLYFCFMSNLSYEEGDTTEAWLNATKASKWLGISYGVDQSLIVFGKELSNLARSNAKKKSEKYQPLRDYVISQAAKKNFRSKRNAALSLKDDVLKLAHELGIGLSEPQAEKTISSWLDGIVFATKRLR